MENDSVPNSSLKSLVWLSVSAIFQEGPKLLMQSIKDMYPIINIEPLSIDTWVYCVLMQKLKFWRNQEGAGKQTQCAANFYKPSFPKNKLQWKKTI